MKRLLFTAVMWGAVLCGLSFAKEPETQWANEKGIREGKLVKGSASPDGKYALFEFNHWDGTEPTTGTGVGLAPADRSQLLFIIDSRTEYGTDKKVTSFLAVLWNPDSSLLATHDSGDKHSRLNLYRIKDGHATSLDLPDVLAMACGKLGLRKEAVSASGQVPEKWLLNDVLQVAVLVTSHGKKLTAKVPLHIDASGAVSSQ